MRRASAHRRRRGRSPSSRERFSPPRVHNRARHPSAGERADGTVPLHSRPHPSRQSIPARVAHPDAQFANSDRTPRVTDVPIPPGPARVLPQHPSSKCASSASDAPETPRLARASHRGIQLPLRTRPGPALNHSDVPSERAAVPTRALGGNRACSQGGSHAHSLRRPQQSAVARQSQRRILSSSPSQQTAPSCGGCGGA